VSTRPDPPTNVKRTLWGESCGYCMNPDCKKQLITDDKKTSIAEIAHIEPHSQGGGNSAENLLLLCKNCHKLHEPVDRPEEKQKLQQWKTGRQQLLRKTFAVKFSTFDELSAQAKPLLEENHQIFMDYGPHTNNSEAFKLWKKFEPKLITNNTKLKLLFQKNLDLFPKWEGQNNRGAIVHFIRHVDEFAETREEFDGVRQKLFPERMLSIFGVEEEHSHIPQTVNALQNLIRKLRTEGHVVDLDLLHGPHISINRNGEIETVYLSDEPRLRQLYFSKHAYSPKETNLRVDNLIFISTVIKDIGVDAEFENISDLTVIVINGNIRIKLFYSYELSESDLQPVNLTNINYVANLHAWNSAPSTDGAISYAKTHGAKVMTQKELIRFFHNNKP